MHAKDARRVGLIMRDAGGREGRHCSACQCSMCQCSLYMSAVAVMCGRTWASAQIHPHASSATVESSAPIPVQRRLQAAVLLHQPHMHIQREHDHDGVHEDDRRLQHVAKDASRHTSATPSSP